MILTVATTVFSNQIPYIVQGLIWVPHLLTQPCLTTPACVTASLRLHPGHALPETNYRFLLHLIYQPICIQTSHILLQCPACSVPPDHLIPAIFRDVPDLLEVPQIVPCSSFVTPAFAASSSRV